MGIPMLFIEVNLRKTKWLIFAIYHLPSQVDEYFFDEVRKSLDKYIQISNKFLMIGGFNAAESEPALVKYE